LCFAGAIGLRNMAGTRMSPDLRRELCWTSKVASWLYDWFGAGAVILVDFGGGALGSILTAHKLKPRATLSLHPSRSVVTTRYSAHSA